MDKTTLRIKVFWGYSPNAVKTQVWIAVCTYILVAYIKKQLKVEKTMYEMVQILSVSVFSKVPLHELFTNISKNENINNNCIQLNLFDL